MDDELHEAAKKAAATWSVEFFCVVLRLAAREYPDLMRVAFSELFDLSAYEDQAKRIHAVVSKAQEDAAEMRMKVADLELEIDRLRKENEGIRQLSEEVYSRQGKIKTWAAHVVRRIGAVERNGHPRNG